MPIQKARLPLRSFCDKVSSSSSLQNPLARAVISVSDHLLLRCSMTRRVALVATGVSYTESTKYPSKKLFSNVGIGVRKLNVHVREPRLETRPATPPSRAMKSVGILLFYLMYPNHVGQRPLLFQTLV